MKLAHVSPEANLVIRRLLVLATVQIQRLIVSQESSHNKWEGQAQDLFKLVPLTLDFWNRNPVLRDVEEDRLHIGVTIRAAALLDITTHHRFLNNQCETCPSSKDILRCLNDCLFYLEGA